MGLNPGSEAVAMVRPRLHHQLESRGFQTGELTSFMKTLCFAAIAAASMAVSHGQGTVSFSNRTPGVNALVYDISGITPLSGQKWAVGLFVGPVGTPAPSLLQYGPWANVGTGSLSAGYFDAGPVTLFYPSGQQVMLQVRAWDSSGGDFYNAIMLGFDFGCSRPFISEPLGEFGSTGAPLAGLQSFAIAPWLGYNDVPEPSSIGLLGVGVFLLLSQTRKHLLV